MEGKKVIVVGAGPVGSLAALYAASRGAIVQIYELRSGKSWRNRRRFLLPLDCIVVSLHSAFAAGGCFGACSHHEQPQIGFFY